MGVRIVTLTNGVEAYAPRVAYDVPVRDGLMADGRSQMSDVRCQMSDGRCPFG